MQPIIWAFGSMFVLLLIVSLLPLGFTLKGKFTIVIASLVFALVGTAAVSLIPLWQTGLILLVLVFFAAYLFDKRMATVIYQKSEVLDEFIELEQESIEKLSGVINQRMKEEDVLQDVPLQSLDKVIKNEFNLNEISIDLQKTENHDPEDFDEDVSFLLHREIEESSEQTDDLNQDINYLSDIDRLLMEDSQNNSVTTKNLALEMKELNPESGYLSDIESLLEMESGQQLEESDDLKEIDILSPIASDKEMFNLYDDIDNPLNEILQAKVEAASTSDKMLEEIVFEKSVSLKK